MQQIPALSPLRFSAILIVLTTLSAVGLQAQSPAAPLITEPIDEAKLVSLRGNVHPLAQAQYDLGAASDSVPARRLLLLLNRPADRQTALAQYMKDVHALGSATYHQWITPEQFGTRFGAADSDIQTVAHWITAKGFQVTRVSKGKTLIEFSGTFGQVREAFHTAIHRYEVNGELHYANATDPRIPEALAGIVRGSLRCMTFTLSPRFVS
jgi:subtilase family serine protease